MKTCLSPERWLYRIVRRVWSMATAVRQLSEDEPDYRERVAFQMGVFDGRNQGYPCTSPFVIPAGKRHCSLSDAWCTGHSVGAMDYTSPNVSDQIPRTQDVANTTDSPERLSASVLFVLGWSWLFI